MTTKCFRTASAMSFAIFGLSGALAALARRDADYAAIDGSMRRAIEHQNQAATISDVTVWALILTIVFLILSFLVPKQKKCPSCAEMIKKEANKCRYCGTESVPELT